MAVRECEARLWRLPIKPPVTAARRAVIWRWARWRRSCSRRTTTLITGWPCRSSTVPCPFSVGSWAKETSHACGLRLPAGRLVFYKQFENA